MDGVDVVTEERPDPAESPRPRSRVRSVAFWAATVAGSAALALALAWLFVGRDSGGRPADRLDPQDLVQGRPGTDATVAGVAEVGRPAPATTVERLDAAGALTLSQAAEGRPMIVNFWSSTCAPCLAEMPAIQRIHTARPDLAVVGINVSDGNAAALEMLRTTGVTYPQGRDPKGTVIAAFGGAALPHTVLIDRSGTVVRIKSGALTEDALRRLLADTPGMG